MAKRRRSILGAGQGFQELPDLAMGRVQSILALVSRGDPETDSAIGIRFGINSASINPHARYESGTMGEQMERSREDGKIIRRQI
jgi:hypothetical protein